MDYVFLKIATSALFFFAFAYLAERHSKKNFEYENTPFELIFPEWFFPFITFIKFSSFLMIFVGLVGTVWTW